ncbi:MAG: lytic murein transglycosylase [Patescibacteria group bacterium]|nr:lytic murein transglycosylase [Patescibacteria group bacterium]
MKDEGKKALLLLLFLALLAIILLGEEKEFPPALERAVKKLEKERFARSELEKIFSDPRLEFYNDIGELKKKKVDYFEAAFGLFSLNSIARGREFLTENKSVLERSEKEFQVSKEVIVAILRLETNFGSFVGRRRLISTFYSMLILDFRADFAEKEMLNLFLIARKNHEDPYNYSGSYMGAFGLPQFLPSSYLQYGVDGDGDGRVDLNKVDDAVMSVARYLRAHGWKRGDFYRQKEAILSYNHDLAYVLAIITYSNFLK